MFSIHNDPLYKNLYKEFESHEKLNEILQSSGFIHEERTELDTKAINDLNLITVPILDMKNDNKPLALIVSTGSFSPIHCGHIKMLELAKEYIESLDYNIVQGVISLSHDKYVDIKNNGIAKLDIGIRTNLVYEKIKNYDWLTVDRLEGELVSIPINFSTVLERLKKYFEYHLNQNITVFYVFGSDNKEFSQSFINNTANYHSICIERTGYDFNQFKVNLSNQKNIHFLNNNSKEARLSSTEVRKVTNNNDAISDKLENKKIYFIRTDSVPNDFSIKLMDILKGNIKDNVEFRLFSSKDFQFKNKVGVISLDKFIQTEYNLDVSRLFYLSSFQKKAIKMTGYERDIIEQIENIKEGEYILLDDDISTGFTMKNITNILSQKNIKIVNYQLLINQLLNDNEEVFDIIDARDFLLGAYKSGLVTTFKNKTIRTPYFFPYINLSTRANVLPEKERVVTREILKLNLEYNKGVSKFAKFFNFEDNDSFVHYLIKYIENGILK